MILNFRKGNGKIRALQQRSVCKCTGATVSMDNSDSLLWLTALYLEVLKSFQGLLQELQLSVAL